MNQPFRCRIKSFKFKSAPALGDAGNVTIWRGLTKLSIPPDRVLQNATRHGLSEVVVVGWRADNNEFYFLSSEADGGTVIWLLEMAKKKLLEVEVGQDGRPSPAA